MAEPLQRSVLHAAHVAARGRMVAFAGYDMPVQYPGERGGVLVEHRWTRERAGLFDVSHMGPAWLELGVRTGDADADHRAVAALIEPLVCGDIAGLRPGQLRYTLLLNAQGGIIDDLMIGRPAAAADQGALYIVVNAGTKERDFHLIADAAQGRARLVRADDGGLLALQGPLAASAVERIFPGAETLGFMNFAQFEREGARFTVARSGYTGEDGFEVHAPASAALGLWEDWLRNPDVAPIGLGARDSLRLEAGLPLYGHDLDATTSPIEAGLAFAVSKRRRLAGDFPGAARILHELETGCRRVRVGLALAPRAPAAREGAQVIDAAGINVGVVTSGGPSPTLGAAVALAFVDPAFAALGTSLAAVVRGRPEPATVVATPFVAHRYVRKPFPPQ